MEEDVAMSEVKTTCRYCVGSCGLVAKLDDDGRVVSVRGDRDHPLSAGFACIRGLQTPEAMNSPERILRPLKRQPDGSFKEIALETALDEIAAQLGGILKESGGEAVALFKGTQTWKNVTAVKVLDAWPIAIGSTRIFTSITIDQSCKQITMRRMGYWDAGKHRLGDSDVLMVVGSNPFVSIAFANLSYDPVKRLKAALKRGLKLIVIDPRYNETAHSAHLFLQPKPGEDPTLFAGLLRVILSEGWYDQAFCDAYVAGLDALKAAVEPFTLDYVAARTGVAAGAIVDVARMFALECRSGVAAAGTGPSMSPRSNLSDHLIECLNVICARYYREGAEILNPGVQNKRRAYRAEVVTPFREWENGPRTSTGHGQLFGELMSGVLADEILREDPGRIRALFSNGANPAVALPDQVKAVKALQSLELLVAVEPFMTATARLSHYILPPKLQLERTDTSPTPIYEAFYDLPVAQYVPAVVEPPKGSDVADDWYVYWALAKRLGLQLKLSGEPVDMETAPTTDDILALILKDAQVPFEEIKKSTEAKVYDVGRAFVEPRRPEATGRFDIMPADVAAELEEVAAEWRDERAVEPAAPAPGGPFTHLLSVRRLKGTMNSLGLQLPEIRHRHPFNAAHIHPDDLAGMGFSDGSEIELVSDHGSVPAIAQADDSMRPGVISMSHCWGGLPDENLPYEVAGASTNLLVRTDKFVEVINAMPRMSSVPIRVVARRVAVPA